jgi:opacity protein-like surface antigen
MPRRPIRTAVLAAALALAATAASAYIVTITAGTRSIYLQVGAGSMTGTNFTSGGTPANNATVNTVSVTVPAASLGTGAQPMTTNSAVTTSPYDGYAFCPITTPARSVYIGGYYRTPGTGANATLTVTVPATLASGANSLPFNTISWVSIGNGDNTPAFPSGTFVGGATTTLLSVTRNTWFETCMQFSYANSAIFPAGTYTNRVTYTLTSP